jgi:hypothetical protein
MKHNGEWTINGEAVLSADVTAEEQDAFFARERAAEAAEYAPVTLSPAMARLINEDGEGYGR